MKIKQERASRTYELQVSPGLEPPGTSTPTLGPPPGPGPRGPPAPGPSPSSGTPPQPRDSPPALGPLPSPRTPPSPAPLPSLVPRPSSRRAPRPWRAQRSCWRRPTRPWARPTTMTSPRWVPVWCQGWPCPAVPTPGCPVPFLSPAQCHPGLGTPFLSALGPRWAGCAAVGLGGSRGTGGVPIVPSVPRVLLLLRQRGPWQGHGGHCSAGPGGCRVLGQVCHCECRLLWDAVECSGIQGCSGMFWDKVMLWNAVRCCRVLWDALG